MPGDGGAPAEADSDSDGYISASELHRRMLEKKKRFCKPEVVAKGAYFDVYGTEARAEVIVHPAGPKDRLTARDVQNLVRWVVADGENPKWVFVKNKPLVKKVVMVHVPTCTQSLAQWCGAPRTVVGGASAEALLSCPVKTTKRARPECVEERVESRWSSDRVWNGSRENQPSLLPPAAARENQPSLLPAARENQLSPLLACKNQLSSLPAAHENEPSQPSQPSLPPSLSPSQPSLPPSLSPSQPSLPQSSLSLACDNQPSLPACQDQPSQPSLRAACEDQPPLPASFYILTADQLRLNGYPNHGGTELLPGYVRTLPAAAAANVTSTELVAIDCEMCYTQAGLELTRVSAVDSSGSVLLDTLVKPTNAITNYNTQYSGITAAMLAPVTTTLAEVQARILALVHADTILVGHSLENDLTALKLAHARVLDTAVLYQRRGYKLALRSLTARHLQRSIQGDDHGHDSVEDARATMDLALLKIRNGPGFPGGVVKPKSESLIHVLARHGRRSALVDRPSEVQQHAVSSCDVVAAASDDEVCVKAVEEVGRSGVDFVWAQFRDADEALEDRVRRVYEALQPNSLLIVTTARGEEWKSRQGGGESRAFTCMK